MNTTPPTVATVVAQFLNALLYAAVLFLIAGGLSLVYGVMRIVNLAHGNLYALGAFVMAWIVGRAAGSMPAALLLTLLPLAALAGAVRGGGGRAALFRTPLKPAVGDQVPVCLA